MNLVRGNGVTWSHVPQSDINGIGGSDRYSFSSGAYAEDKNLVVTVGYLYDNPATRMIFVSEDRGETWETYTWPLALAPPTSMCYAKHLGLFVAIWDTNDVIAYSSDGKNWSSTTAPTSNWKKIIYAEDKELIVAFGLNKVMTCSQSITTWTDQPNIPVGNWQQACYSQEKGLFVAISQGGTNTSMASSDAVTWTGSVTMNMSGGNPVYASHLGKFLAVNDYWIHSSDNGVNWSQLTNMVGTKGLNGSVAYSEVNGFVVFANRSPSPEMQNYPYDIHTTRDFMASVLWAADMNAIIQDFIVVPPSLPIRPWVKFDMDVFTQQDLWETLDSNAHDVAVIGNLGTWGGESWNYDIRQDNDYLSGKIIQLVAPTVNNPSGELVDFTWQYCLAEDAMYLIPSEDGVDLEDLLYLRLINGGPAITINPEIVDDRLPECPEPPNLPAITSVALEDGWLGDSYSDTVLTTGDTPITFSIETPSGGETGLPPGLSINASTGVISGTVTAGLSYGNNVGNWTFTVKATNTHGSDTKAMAINVGVPKPAYTNAATQDSNTLLAWSGVPNGNINGTRHIEYALASSPTNWLSPPSPNDTMANGVAYPRFLYGLQPETTVFFRSRMSVQANPPSGTVYYSEWQYNDNFGNPAQATTYSLGGGDEHGGH